MVFALLVIVLIATIGFMGITKPPVERNYAQETLGTEHSAPATPSASPSSLPAPSTTATPRAASTSSVKGAQATPNNFGLSVGTTLYGLPSKELAHRLDDMKSLGISWLRLDFDWNHIQPDGPTRYNWSETDTVISAAQARNLQLLPIITYTAPWARHSDCRDSPVCRPADPTQFATFARAAASRYASRGIHHWEIWNEPNMTIFWQTQPNAAHYTALLRATYTQIKSADKSATVLLGGLASIDHADGVPQLEYLNAVYAAGGKGYFDAVAYHPYSFPVPASYKAIWNAWSKMDFTSPSVRSIMRANGDSSKKIWITEYGAPTNGPGPIATTTNYNLTKTPDHVNEALQAAMVTDMVRSVKAAPWIAAAFWYSYKDEGTDANNTENFYGLLRANGSAKPAYTTLKRELDNL